MFVFSWLWVSCFFAAPTAAEMSERHSVEYPQYSGVFVATADPFSRPTGALYLLTFPPTLTGFFGFSIGGRVTLAAFVGFSTIPTAASGALASGLVKVHVLRPDERRWGLAGQLQWVGGGAVTEGDGEAGGAAGSVTAAQLIASSPLRRFRTHLGVALHTLPGSGYSPGDYGAQLYDFENLQTTIFVSAEKRITTRGSVFAEWIWGAAGADGGYDSAAVLLLGGQLRRGHTYYKLVIGALATQFGSGFETYVPIPPLVAVSHTF
jgi:hypothetical protein